MERLEQAHARSRIGLDIGQADVLARVNLAALALHQGAKRLLARTQVEPTPLQRLAGVDGGGHALTAHAVPEHVDRCGHLLGVSLPDLIKNECQVVVKRRHRL